MLVTGSMVFVGLLLAGYLFNLAANVRVPLVYSAKELKEWPVSEKAKHGPLVFWRPARSCGFTGFRYFGMRVRIAFEVLHGRMDAVRWGDGSGEAPNDGSNYRDTVEEERERKRQAGQLTYAGRALDGQRRSA